ncbi:MAG: glyoxylate carboligase, partial [Burkholderiales bacterium]|nr:glyoxylate carboligase [Burkholderiales bacterium]
QQIGPAIEQARTLMRKHRVPVVLEVMLERVTNIAMGQEIDRINEFEPVLDLAPEPGSAVAAAAAALV